MWHPSIVPPYLLYVLTYAARQLHVHSYSISKPRFRTTNGKYIVFANDLVYVYESSNVTSHRFVAE